MRRKKNNCAGFEGKTKQAKQSQETHLLLRAIRYRRGYKRPGLQLVRQQRELALDCTALVSTGQDTVKQGWQGGDTEHSHGNKLATWSQLSGELSTQQMFHTTQQIQIYVRLCTLQSGSGGSVPFLCDPGCSVGSMQGPTWLSSWRSSTVRSCSRWEVNIWSFSCSQSCHTTLYNKLTF